MNKIYFYALNYIKKGKWATVKGCVVQVVGNTKFTAYTVNEFVT